MTIETPTVPDLPASNMSEVEALVQFLSERIAEKEAAARAALEYLYDHKGFSRWTTAPYDHAIPWPIALFIRSRSPEQALAECAAHRQIIAANVGGMRRKNNAPDHFVSWSSSDPGPYVTLTGFLGPEISLNASDSAEFINHYYEPLPPNRTLKALALPDAGHPDFNEAWRV